MTSTPAYSTHFEVCVCINAHVVSVVVRRLLEPPIGLVAVASRASCLGARRRRRRCVSKDESAGESAREKVRAHLLKGPLSSAGMQALRIIRIHILHALMLPEINMRVM